MNCGCDCHTNGAYPPPCSVLGGCGPHDDQQPAHRCERGARCYAAEGDAGAPCDRPLCNVCVDAVAETLNEAPYLYDDLRARARDRGNQAQGQRVTSSRPGSFGLNLGPLDATERLHWHVTAWADEVISTAERPTVDRAAQPERDQVVDACILLNRYLSVWVAHHPVEFQLTRATADPDDPKLQPTNDTVTATQTGWEACGWLIDWRLSAERMLRTALLVHYPPEPCPACNQTGGLKRKDGDDKVSCAFCRKSWTLRMYETFVHAWVGGAAEPDPRPHLGPASAAEGHDARRGTRADTDAA
jgi:hypothetical protein